MAFYELLFLAISGVPLAWNKDIHVMTLDTQLSESSGRLSDASVIFARQIEAENPDAVALQEIDSGSLERIQKILGSPWRSVGQKADGFRCAILTKHPVTEEDTTEDFYVAARVNHPRQSFDIFSVHLSNQKHNQETACNQDEPMAYHAEDKSIRMQQVRTLVQKADERGFNGPTILAGNFEVPSHDDWTEDVRLWHCGKAVPWPVTQYLLRNRFIDAFRRRHPSVAANPGITYPMFKTTKTGVMERFDYVLYRTPTQQGIEVYEAYTIYGPSGPGANKAHVWPSDHAAVVVIFERVTRPTDPDATSIRIMIFNTWRLGAFVTDGVRKVAKQIKAVNPAAVAIQECERQRRGALEELLGNDWNVVLASRGQGRRFVNCILSRYRMTKITSTLDADFPSATVHHPLGDFDLWGVYLNYADFAPYKAFIRQDTCANILAAEKNTLRSNQIDHVLENVARLSKKGLVFIGGDFNSGSHLDWIHETKHLEFHAGCVAEWPATKKPVDAGFVDAYRQFYPDPLQFPGYTWTPVQRHETHLPHDRIDFLFYRNNTDLRPTNAFIFCGYDPILGNMAEDAHETARGLDVDAAYKRNEWPSDHCSVVFDFEWIKPGQQRMLETCWDLEQCKSED